MIAAAGTAGGNPAPGVLTSAQESAPPFVVWMIKGGFTPSPPPAHPLKPPLLGSKNTVYKSLRAGPGLGSPGLAPGPPAIVKGPPELVECIITPPAPTGAAIGSNAGNIAPGLPPTAHASESLIWYTDLKTHGKPHPGAPAALPVQVFPSKKSDAGAPAAVPPTAQALEPLLM